MNWWAPTSRQSYKTIVMVSTAPTRKIFTLKRKSLADFHHRFCMCAIGSGPIPFRDRDWKKQSPQAMDLIRACLEVDPTQRITVNDALQHPWFETEWIETEKEKDGKRDGNERRGLLKCTIASILSIIYNQEKKKKRSTKLQILYSQSLGEPA